MRDESAENGWLKYVNDSLISRSRRNPAVNDMAPETADLRNVLLGGLVAFADHSKHRQADLSAVIYRCNIFAKADHLREVLTELLVEGSIRDIVPLYDGGLLVTVTGLGADRTKFDLRWRAVESVVAINNRSSSSLLGEAQRRGTGKTVRTPQHSR